MTPRLRMAGASWALLSVANAALGPTSAAGLSPNITTLQDCERAPNIITLTVRALSHP